jgi:hypothetical protein
LAGWEFYDLIVTRFSFSISLNLQVAEYLLKLFRAYDSDQSGRLHLKDVAKALRESIFGLSELQLQVVLSEADADASEGTVNYREFSYAAAGLVSTMIRVATDAAQAERIVLLRSSDSELTKILGMDADAFKGQLFDMLAVHVHGDTGRGERVAGALCS